MKKLILTLSFLASLFSLRSQLYGTTSIGGKGGGTITSLNLATSTLKANFTFDTQDGAYPSWHSRPIQASDGKLYGMTSGGSNLVGTIYSYYPAKDIYTKLYDLDYFTGTDPFGSLLQASDGILYGMTNNGGANGRGVLFSFNLIDSIYTDLFDFGGTNGEFPYGSLFQASDGRLYGMTVNGGANDYGVIFSYDIHNKVFTKLADFDGTNGKNPTGDFIEGANGKLYAMTFDGGKNNLGTLFSFKPSTLTLTKLLDFDETNGNSPYGSLISSADGNFYGITSKGGESNLGVIFSYNPSTGTYSRLKSFDYTTGSHPQGSLLQTIDGKLYGMTSEGGDYYKGVLFSYDITNNVYKRHKDFNGPDGAYTQGSLMQSTDGTLYGTTYTGGDGDRGVLFSYNPGSDVFAKLRDFGVNATGSLMYGGLTADASGKLYGMTYSGGRYGNGVIFSFDPLSATYARLIDFDGKNSGSPYSNSLMLALDGKFYGMTLGGGVRGNGAIFCYNPTNSKYKIAKKFNGTDGSAPYGNLLEASNGKFYGMTSGGGSKGSGVLFSFDPVTSVFTKLLNFEGTNGAYPAGSLMQAKDDKLYGVTYNGGAHDWGVLFSFDITEGSYKKLMEFDTSTGINPSGKLVQSSDGKLYGMTSYGVWGSIFSYNPSTNVFEKVKNFNYADGAVPKGSLIDGQDGKFYGMTREGGAYGNGVCFSFDPVTAIYTKIQDFNGENGKAPEYTFFTGNNRLLPLKLISFSAVRNGKTNLLNWTTAQEINTKNFEIQRSSNGRGFINIGAIPSLTNGKLQNNYTFTDEHPLKSVNYYRLKMVDKDGKFVYTSIRQLDNIIGFDLAILPNPVHDILKLSFTTEKATIAQIAIVDAVGKTLYNQKIQVSYGASIQNINVALLSNGNYFLKCSTTDGERELKFIKQ